MKKNCFLILGIALLAVLLLFLSKLSLSAKTPTGLVRIYVDQRLFAEERLQDECDITIMQDNGDVNIFHLTQDGFYMKEANCLTHQCIEQGKVTIENYSTRVLGTKIICAHHNVWAELVLTDLTPPPDMPDI